MFFRRFFCFTEPPHDVSREKQQLTDINAVALGDLSGGYDSGCALLGYRGHERDSVLDVQHRAGKCRAGGDGEGGIRCD